MSDVIEEKQFRLDWLKWLVVAALVAGAIYGNWYYSAESVLYRVLALLVVAVVSGQRQQQLPTAPKLCTTQILLSNTNCRKLHQRPMPRQLTT